MAAPEPHTTEDPRLSATHGAPQAADLLEHELIGRNIVEGRWSLQVVEEHDDTYWSVFRALESRVRDELMAGRRHIFEAEMKEDRRSHGVRHHEAVPDDDGPNRRRDEGRPANPLRRGYRMGWTPPSELEVDEMTEKGSTEEFEVTVGNVVGKIMELIREGNVRRITLKRDGKKLIEIPLNAGLTVGAITALVAPLLLGVGALAAVITRVTIVVERPSGAE